MLHSLHVRCKASGQNGNAFALVQPVIKVSENHCLGLVGAGC